MHSLQRKANEDDKADNADRPNEDQSSNEELSFLIEYLGQDDYPPHNMKTSVAAIKECIAKLRDAARTFVATIRKYRNNKLEAKISQEYVMWNHGISEVVNNLIKNGLEIESLNEYDYSPYNCFNQTIEFEPKKFRIKHLENKIPMVYSVVAKKNNS